MELFYEILHSDWLNKGCKIILFLTHKDRLIEYIRNGHSIKTFSNNFKKWKWRPEGYDVNGDHDDDNKNNTEKRIRFSDDLEINHIDKSNDIDDRNTESAD